MRSRGGARGGRPGRWNAQGTEIALRAVERLTARGLDVRLGDVVELSLPEETYAVVTLIEVLEHVA